MIAATTDRYVGIRVADSRPGTISVDRDTLSVAMPPEAWRVVRTLAARAGEAVPIIELMRDQDNEGGVGVTTVEAAVDAANRHFRDGLRTGPSSRLIRAAGRHHYALDYRRDEVIFDPLPWDGPTLARARGALGLTQVQMAAALGMTQTTICTKEADPSTLAADVRIALAVEALLRRAGRWPLEFEDPRRR